MPKILINEKVYSELGAADRYSNYAVLVAGFRGRTPVLTAYATEENPADEIQPDSNGVYEFASYQDFEDTIGLVAPGHDCGDGEHSMMIYHYGNQMAYELLRLGYPIIYLPIDSDVGVSMLEDASTWEIFKDKVSYDFRFITHGLLKSYKTGDSKDLEDRIADLEAALEELDKIYSIKVDLPTDSRVETTAEQEEAYKLLLNTQTLRGCINPITGNNYMTLSAALFGGTDGIDAGSIGIIAELKNKQSLYAKRITPALINNVNTNIANLACYADNVPNLDTGRGDCVALIELDENTYTGVVVKPEQAIVSAINEMSGINEANGAYCAMTVPSVVYKMDDNENFANNKKFPGAFHYLACFMNSLQQGFAEWYAAAGYTRGVSSYRIDKATVTLGEIAINTLEPRNDVGSENSPKFACNVIANFRGSYYLWGNRTALMLKSPNGTTGDLKANHFLNIRQLCTTVKKQLHVACRRFTFDPNSDALWFNFVNAIRPTLDAMKADQGIRDYKIMKVADSRKATLKAKIRLIPIEAIEDFDIEVSLEDSFGETAVNATESV